MSVIRTIILALCICAAYLISTIFFSFYVPPRSKPETALDAWLKEELKRIESVKTAQQPQTNDAP
jgi:hypothetical protein